MAFTAKPEESRARSQAVAKRFESDARALVPVTDEIGGIVLYLSGKPAYYVLNGEWFEAVAGPPDRRAPSSDEVLAGQTADVCALVAGENMSTL